MVKVKTVIKYVKGKGAPAYMVSFGDMMTLILCFFILLVSMSEERHHGLVAKGLGSFIVAIKSHGLDGIMSAQEKQGVFDPDSRKDSSSVWFPGAMRRSACTRNPECGQARSIWMCSSSILSRLLRAAKSASRNGSSAWEKSISGSS